MTEYYDSFLSKNALENSLPMGEFVDEKYVLSKEVIDSLVKIKKCIDLYKQEFILCSTQILNKTIKFKIKLNNIKNEGITYAGLYLTETYKVCGEEKTIETFLVSYRDFDGADYFDKLKKEFNLYTKFENDGKDLKDSYDFLEKLINKKSEHLKILVKEISMNSRIYAQEILKILNKYEFSNSIIFEELKERIKSVSVNKNSDLYWITVKDIIDEIIFKKYSSLKGETKKWLDLVNQNYILMYKNKKKKCIEILEKNSVKKEDKPKIVEKEKKKSKTTAKASSSSTKAKKANKKAKKANKNQNDIKDANNNTKIKQTYKEPVKNITKKGNEIFKDMLKLYAIKKTLNLEKISFENIFSESIKYHTIKNDDFGKSEGDEIEL